MFGSVRRDGEFSTGNFAFRIMERGSVVGNRKRGRQMLVQSLMSNVFYLSVPVHPLRNTLHRKSGRPTSTPFPSSVLLVSYDPSVGVGCRRITVSESATNSEGSVVSGLFGPRSPTNPRECGRGSTSGLFLYTGRTVPRVIFSYVVSELFPRLSKSLYYI